MMNILIFVIFDFVPAVIFYAAFAGLAIKAHKANKLKKELQKQLQKQLDKTNNKNNK